MKTHSQQSSDGWLGWKEYSHATNYIICDVYCVLKKKKVKHYAVFKNKQ